MPIDVTTQANVGWDKTAYNLAVDYALRPQLPFNAVADVMPLNLDHPGATIKFKVMTEMAAAVTALLEDEDVTPVDLASTEVTLTLAEYGNAIRMSPVLTGTGYILPFDPIAAELVGFNAALSLDSLARDAVQGKSGSEPTNIKWASPTSTESADNEVDTADTFTGAFARFLHAKLTANNAMPSSGNAFTGFIHPDVAYDFQQDTGTGNWLAAYQGSGELDPLKMNSIGVFAGINWVVTPRSRLITNAGNGTGGAGNIDVYAVSVVGRQAVCKGYAQATSGPLPDLRAIPVTDVLSRFSGIGWYWYGGFARYREAAQYHARVASSIGANT